VVDEVEIRPADPARGDLDEQLPGAWPGILDVVTHVHLSGAQYR
jgi:hypothetical protein